MGGPLRPSAVPRRHVSSSAGAGYRAAQHARRKLHVPVALYPQDSPGLVACGLYGPWLADEATRVVFTTDVALLQVRGGEFFSCVFFSCGGGCVMVQQSPSHTPVG